ncbi:MAG TPA: hypothetical protein IAB66_05245 [Candidatus Caccousia avistercoris]|nr:hypothetical protein [Candidatus Caccousia avistercoris]
MYLDLEPVPFNKGFYSVDMTFFFDVSLDIFSAPVSASVVVSGVSIFNKKVILYGGEGNVKSFSSDNICETFDASCNKVLPRASVQVAQPIGLAACLKDCCMPCDVCFRIPEGLTQRYGGPFDASCTRGVYITLGLFTIVQIVRNVQMLIPTYDFCIPEKECACASTDNPCEMFSRIEFPTSEFFPPKASGEAICSNSCPSCSCSTCSSGSCGGSSCSTSSCSTSSSSSCQGSMGYSGCSR